MPKYRITYAFNCSCYGERTFEAESPEHARQLAIELNERDELMTTWEAEPDLGTDNERVVSIIDDETEDTVDDGFDLDRPVTFDDDV